MQITPCSKSTELQGQSWDEECASGWSSSLKSKLHGTPYSVFESSCVVKSLAGFLGAV